MKQVRTITLGLALLLCVSFSLAQDYSDYSGRTINIQPLIPYTGLPTNDTARTINASQTVTYGQNNIQSIDVQYQYKIAELEGRIVRLEQNNTDAQNRIAALEAANTSLASQVTNLQNSITTNTTTPSPPTTTTNSGSSYLQVGAFSRIDLAGQLVYRLQELGYQVWDSTSSTGVTKLFVGPFANSLIPEEQYKLSLQNIRDSFPIAVP